jgi:hypothetical protein
MLAGMDTTGMKYRTPDGRGPYRESRVWAVIGITLAVLLAIGGLAMVGAMVLFYVAMSHYGSNK